MGIGPKPNKTRPFLIRSCTRCGESYDQSGYSPTKSYFYPDGYLPICNKCINQYLEEHNWDWKYVDKICQYADIPFVPKEWIRVQELAGDEAFPRYASVFLSSEFEGFGWGEYFEEYQRLKEEMRIEEEVPLMDEKKRQGLIRKWDGEYTDEDFQRLEDLLQGMLLTQNITTHLQMDQALKLCKISLTIDSAIRAGDNIDKLLASYEKLVKIANFTPKNSKNASDLESTGELFKWLEAGGWKNKFYDGVTRDVIDEEMKNIESWNQRLYINETGIGEDISRRLEALKTINENEQGVYDLGGDFDLDQHEVDGYNELLFDDEAEDFIADFDEEGDDDE